MGVKAIDKKNCDNCRHLEWVEGDGYDDGYSSSEDMCVCNMREYKTESEEAKHTYALESEKYRLKSKVCFEPKVKK